MVTEEHLKEMMSEGVPDTLESINELKQLFLDEKYEEAFAESHAITSKIFALLLTKNFLE